ncbi:regulatory protein, tetR family [Nonomuraea maritima]|uniref:Regulatory protein, tetR family n=1 Tax=Nonomuraea maritima TaxID=683260 RepID=A0A1G9BSG8_9ACTN|nr:TetR family transcriptional regulator [Nonomuraea maritima]SDK42377.1 regulatory protein, tetR family [Nonomuraea maritima]
MTPNLPQRADALRNHQRIVAAARALFAERGPNLTVPQVAEGAGVGRATVYRSFPTKEELLLELAREGFRELEDLTLSALAADEPYEALAGYVPELLDRLARDRGLAAVFFEGRLLPAGRLVKLIGLLVEAAKASGQVRPDAGVVDVRVVLCGIVRQLIVLDERDPAVWRRYADMILAALRR